MSDEAQWPGTPVSASQSGAWPGKPKSAQQWPGTPLHDRNLGKLPAQEAGAIDPSIVARTLKPEPGYFDPEKKFYGMLTSDPTGTLRKLGGGIVQEAKNIIGQVAPSHLAQVARQTGQETAANVATPETAGEVANLAQLALRGAPGGAAGIGVKPTMPARVEPPAPGTPPLAPPPAPVSSPAPVVPPKPATPFNPPPEPPPVVKPASPTATPEGISKRPGVVLRKEAAVNESLTKAQNYIHGLSEVFGLPKLPVKSVGEKVGTGTQGGFAFRYAPNKKLAIDDFKEYGIEIPPEYVFPSHIVINPSLEPPHQAWALAHEFGHYLQWTKLLKTDAATRADIINAWQKEKSAGTITRDPIHQEIMQQQNPNRVFGTEAVGYEKHFGEWFANQAATWLTTNKPATTLAGKFFKGVAAAWKRIYEKVAGRKGTAPEVAAFMKREGNFANVQRARTIRQPDIGAGVSAMGKAIEPVYTGLNPPPTPSRAFINSTDDSFYRLRGAATADKAEFDRWVRTLPPELNDARTQERLFKYMEGDRSITLTPEEQALHDQYIVPGRREAQDLYEGIKKLAPGTLSPDFDPEYAHRMVKGKTKEIDPWMGQAGQAASPVSGYRARSAPALKDRVYYAMENNRGQRKVVAVTDHGTVVINQGQASPLPRYQGGATKVGDTFSIGGEKWTIKNARTSEIEANTSTRYYKNAVASTIKNVVQLRAVARALAEIERLKQTPEWAAYTVSRNAEKPEGWRSVDFPPYSHWWFHPDFADLIEDFWTYKKPALGEKLAAINRASVGSMFWSPVPHALNAGAHWVTARGWDWVTPQGLRSAMMDTAKAVREVVTQGPKYRQLLREGSGLIYGSVANEEFYRTILNHLGESVKREPFKWDPIARAMGVGPSDLVRMLYGASSRALWSVSDMMMVQRVLELEHKGMSTRAAIADAEKHIPNYRIPPQVLGSRLFAQALKDTSLTAFSRYHYGQWKSYAHMAKDLAVGTPEEKFKAMGNVLATAVLIAIVGPMINRGIQSLTGDKKLEMGPKGSTSIPMGAWDAWHGKPIEQVIQNSITLSPVPKWGIEEFFNTDLFTNKKIREPYDQEKHRFGRLAAQTAEHTAQHLLSPYSTISQAETARHPLGITESLAKQGLGLRKPFSPYRGRTGGGTLAQQAARRHSRPRGMIEQLEKKAEGWLRE